MGENENQQQQPNPIISFFENTRLFLFPDGSKQQNTKPQLSHDDDVIQSSSPDMVKFVDSNAFPPSLKLQTQDSDQTNATSPAVLFQVYALGGFIVVKWLWARWNERRNLPKQDEDQEPHPDPTPTLNE